MNYAAFRMAGAALWLVAAVLVAVQAAQEPLKEPDTTADGAEEPFIEPSLPRGKRQVVFQETGEDFTPQKYVKDPITGQYVPVPRTPGGITGVAPAGILGQLPWLAQFMGPAGISLPLGSSQFTRNTNYVVGRDERDLMYQECRTPQGQYGRCRHLQYCVLPSITSYDTLLPHACVVENRFVGVCCPQPAPGGVAPGYPPLPGTSGGSQSSSSGSSASVTCGTVARGVRAQLPPGTDTRIVGGLPSSPGEFPWVVSLMRADATPNQYCGGALLSNRHVMTAAHCVGSFDRSLIWVRVGEHDFSKDGDTPHRNVRIASFRVHQAFNPRTFENDIALLHLAQPVEFNDFVRPICLPPPNRSFENQMATVAGWGALRFQGPVSPVLNEVTLPVWDNNRCDQAYGQPIRPSMVCAGLPQGGKDSCQDDSGGPLMANVNGRRTVIGIVSFGTRCAEPNKPGVYTRVSAFLDWIRANA